MPWYKLMQKNIKLELTPNKATRLKAFVLRFSSKESLLVTPMFRSLLSKGKKVIADLVIFTGTLMVIL
jgi:hypothetical protein